MNISRIRHILGFAWFYLLAFATASVVISTDADVDSLANALTLPNLPTVIVFSFLFALLAVPTLIFFYRRQWRYGLIFALVAALVFWGIVLAQQTTTSPLTLSEALSLLPRIIGMLGGWTVLAALPAALLLNGD
ncbi:MAG: hypothetical protein AAFY17_08235 [Cyanobacteria bacterium J06642_11]